MLRATNPGWASGPAHGSDAQHLGEKALTAQYESLKLKEHAARVGRAPTLFSAHSLRAGFITQAVRSGKSERRVKEHSGHKSWDVLNAYVR